MRQASVVIPTLNEAAHIEGLLRQLLVQMPASVLEILVADGRSGDQTRELALRVAATEPRVKLIDNPRRTQAAAMNLAAVVADPRSEVLVRVDAHSNYPANFLSMVMQELDATRAESVVVRLRTVGRTCFQKAVAGATNSWAGTGGSVHRVGGGSRYVDHGHHAAFDRAAFSRLGGYDTSLASNEDAEFDTRLALAGGRVWFTSKVEVDYFPRTTPLALVRQYFRYGRGRAQNVRKHGRLRVRQFLPPAFLLGVVASLLLALIHPAFLLPPVIYLCAIVGVAGALLASTRQICACLVPLALVIIHFSWASGFLVGLLGPQPRWNAEPLT